MVPVTLIYNVIVLVLFNKNKMLLICFFLCYLPCLFIISLLFFLSLSLTLPLFTTMMILYFVKVRAFVQLIHIILSLLANIVLAEVLIFDIRKQASSSRLLFLEGFHSSLHVFPFFVCALYASNERQRS